MARRCETPVTRVTKSSAAHGAAVALVATPPSHASPSIARPIGSSVLVHDFSRPSLEERSRQAGHLSTHAQLEARDARAALGIDAAQIKLAYPALLQ